MELVIGINWLWQPNISTMKLLHLCNSVSYLLQVSSYVLYFLRISSFHLTLQPIKLSYYLLWRHAWQKSKFSVSHCGDLIKCSLSFLQIFSCYHLVITFIYFRLVWSILSLGACSIAIVVVLSMSLAVYISSFFSLILD